MTFRVISLATLPLGPSLSYRSSTRKLSSAYSTWIAPALDASSMPIRSVWRRLQPPILKVAIGEPELRDVALSNGVGPNPFSRFLGRWDVRRTVVDHLSGRIFQFVGHAEVQSNAYAEELCSVGDEPRLSSRRAYRLSQSTDHFVVCFPDGKPFVSILPLTRQRLLHLCGEDAYRGELFAVDQTCWMETWQVSGPRKRYRSLSRYRRDLPP